MSTIHNVEIVLNDGQHLYGYTAYEVLEQLTRQDWGMPSSVLDFKHNTAERCLILGHVILYWDATSFLQALESAGLLSMIISKEVEA